MSVEQSHGIESKSDAIADVHIRTTCRDAETMARTDAERDWAFRVTRHIDRCESPIELLFLYALSPFSIDCPVVNRDARFGFIVLSSQVALSRFVPGEKGRIDFTLEELDESLQWRRAVAIELDGHDFHERTKEQARRDRSRDRLLQSAGVSVARFTGSEVWSDPFGCAEQAHAMVYEAPERRPM